MHKVNTSSNIRIYYYTLKFDHGFGYRVVYIYTMVRRTYSFFVFVVHADIIQRIMVYEIKKNNDPIIVYSVTFLRNVQLSLCIYYR